MTAASRAATSPLWKLAAVIGFGLAIAVWALARNGEHETGPVVRATLTLPNAGELAFRSNLPTMAFSRDGSRVVFVGSRGETTQLFLRSMDALEDTPIVGTEGATTPFFSYDGQWIGFLAGRELRKIAISGGAPVTIRRSSDFRESAMGMRGASWGPDDQIVLTIISGGLQAVPASGGEPVEITRIDPEAREKAHRFPQILPGGKRVIFTIGTTDMTTFDDARIGFASLESGEHRVLIEGGMFARYSPTGHLLYVRDNALLAVPFDPDEGVVQGTPVRILEGVSNEPSSGVAEFAIADRGTLVYVAGGSRAEMRRLLLADRGGQNKPLTETIERFGAPSVSPDGQQLVVSIDTASSHIWLLDISRGALRKLTHEWDHDEPFWTPDGDAVMYFSARNGVMNLYRHRLDDNVAEALMPGDATQGGGGSWSQNGNVVAYPQVDPVSGFDIWVWKADERQAEPFVKSRFRETKPAFSPDGRWLAYQSDETGRNEVYVRPYPGPGDQYTISTDGGTSPVWSPRGDELFYMNGPRLMAASIRAEPEVEIGRPAQLFEGNFLPSFDVTKDGDHFVLVSPVEVEPTTEFQVVFNWFSERERLVPAE